MGICLYLKWPSCSNALGRLGVTLRMYLMLYCPSTSRLVESLAQPRYRCGRIWTGKAGWLLGMGLSSDSVALLGSRSDSPSEQSELILRLPRPRTERGGEQLGQELSSSVSQ